MCIVSRSLAACGASLSFPLTSTVPLTVQHLVCVPVCLSQSHAEFDCKRGRSDRDYCVPFVSIGGAAYNMGNLRTSAPHGRQNKLAKADSAAKKAAKKRSASKRALSSGIKKDKKDRKGKSKVIVHSDDDAEMPVAGEESADNEEQEAQRVSIHSKLVPFVLKYNLCTVEFE
ncbi:hypothetical protein B0H10DRAFT_1946964 [Mycena sp. CBHHK59/15]|nr:hypothetical protein B0H10DRAFT_1946964 [Mycena sp. CBHHK59/15]